MTIFLYPSFLRTHATSSACRSWTGHKVQGRQVMDTQRPNPCKMEW